jgi:hypothetical protein
MGLAFGYFNGFWWFFCFKNSGFVFNERVESYFYDKRVASYFFPHLFLSNKTTTALNGTTTKVLTPNLNTKNQLNTQAKAIDIKSVNDSTYTQSKSSPKSLFSSSVSATTNNIASNLN